MATKTIKVDKKQSLIDICLQVLGTTQQLFNFAKENGLNIDSDVLPGTILTYDDSLRDIRAVKRIISGNLSIINPFVAEIPEPDGVGFWIIEDTFVIS